MKRDGQLVIAVNTEQTMAEFYRLFEQVLLEQGLAESAAKIQEQILANGCPESDWRRCFTPADLRFAGSLKTDFPYGLPTVPPCLVIT